MILHPSNKKRMSHMLQPWIDVNNIHWKSLSKNTHPCAIQMLREHPDNINWSLLSSNPSKDAIQLLQEYPENIDWHRLSNNPCNLGCFKRILFRMC